MVSGGFEPRELAVPAQISRLAEVRRFAEQAAADFGFDREARYRIKMAASEAVANAVEHGSPSPQHTIVLRASDEAGTFAFYVIDQGNFVQRAIPAEALRERGRGLDFIGQLMDEIEIQPSSEGTVIRFSKRLAGA